jgi:hypothetical protein
MTRQTVQHWTVCRWDHVIDKCRLGTKENVSWIYSMALASKFYENFVQNTSSFNTVLETYHFRQFLTCLSSSLTIITVNHEDETLCSKSRYWTDHSSSAAKHHTQNALSRDTRSYYNLKTAEDLIAGSPLIWSTPWTNLHFMQNIPRQFKVYCTLYLKVVY